MIDTSTDMTNKGDKTIFEAEVINHKVVLIDEFTRLDIRKTIQVDIVNSVEEAKIVATAKVEEAILHMESLRAKLERLRKELIEVEA